MIQMISIKNTRANLADLVDRVAFSGEEFVVTKFGKPKAMLVPVTTLEKKSKGIFDEVFGTWKDRTDIKDSGNFVRELRNKNSLRMKND
jgi:prevent-host-death family protein